MLFVMRLLWNLLQEAWSLLYRSIGTTPLGYWLPVLISFVSFAIGCLRNRHNFMQHLRSNIRDGFIVALVVWSLLYGFDLYQVTRAFLNPAMTSPQTPKLLSESEIADQVSRDLPAPKSLLVPPAHPVSPDNPPTLIDLFNKDFPNLMRVSDNGFDLGSVDGEIIHIGVRVYLDFSGKNEFIGFYIPSSGKEFEACLAARGESQFFVCL